MSDSEHLVSINKVFGDKRQEFIKEEKAIAPKKIIPVQETKRITLPTKDELELFAPKDELTEIFYKACDQWYIDRKKKGLL